MAKRGRIPELKEPVKGCCLMEREIWETMGRLAEKAQMDRSRLMRNIVTMNVQALERSEKVGVFQLSVLLRDLGEDLKEWANGVADQTNAEFIGQWQAE